jgi:hypothetical protein
MKKLPVFFACLLFSFAVLASTDNQENYDIPAIIPTESSPLSLTLENLTTYEKSNAIIDIECDGENLLQANRIEETWNSGNHEEAIELLKTSPELDNAAIGIQWKNPVKISLRWAGDARVGTVDSIVDIDFDVDNSNGHLLAALLHRNGPSNYKFTVNISLDTGKTWAETYVWTANPDYLIDIDGAVLENRFYLAYTYNIPNNIGRIRRFFTSDGSSDEVYGYQTIINETSGLREISLTSNDAHPTPQYLFYFAIMQNDSLRLYYNNDDTLAVSWTAFNPPVADADRGLDACCAYPNKMWASYIGTDNELYFIGGWSSWTVYPTSSVLGTNADYVTSIGAYGDTVMIVYPFYNSPTYDVRYYITSNSGTNWAVGTILSGSNIQSLVNDVTARGGDGFGAVYQTTGTFAEGIYRHRSYNFSSWTTPDSFADNVPRANVKPCIERIADGIYGILYVNWPEQMAWFDRSDWISADGLSLFSDSDTISFGETLELRAYLEKEGAGLAGEELSFDVIIGDGSVNPTSGVTDSEGEVYTEFTAGSTEETVTVEVMWVSENLIDTLSATVDIEVVAEEGIAEAPSVSGISASFGSGEILCEVAKKGEITVKVYDKLGREAGTLLNGIVERGYHPLSLKNLKLASDIYFVVMQGQGIDEKIKIILIN